MIIIEKKDVQNYRYAVGKITFLRLNNNIEVIENYPDSKLMLVSLIDESKKDKRIYISLFGKPTQDSIHTRRERVPLLVYYQKNNYNRYKESGNDVRKLDDTFDKLYQENLEKAFLNPDNFIKTFNDVESSIFKDILIDSRNHLESVMKIRKLYKYRSCESPHGNKYNVNDGSISFVHPKYFNDPFDCNAYFKNNSDMSEMFRVLCLMPENDNIVMWSYYAEEHKGFCFEYNEKDIEDEINNLSLNGLCIVGDVQYSDKRPDLKSTVNVFSYTDIKFYIDTCFTKYKEWSHEKEYRYVLISNDYSNREKQAVDSENVEFISFRVPIIEVYEGIKSDRLEIFDMNNNSIKRIEVKKDETEYKLNI